MPGSKTPKVIPLVLDLASRFVSSVDADRRPRLEYLLKPMMERLGLGVYRVVVMGEIKKGKTSFINALLGDYQLLPTDMDVATSTVYKLIYGPDKNFTAFFYPDKDGLSKEPVSIGPKELISYGTKDGNPDNEKNVDFIGVELPNPLLKRGLAIIDTPGLGGLYKYHREITLRYAPNADAVFFVVDSVESPISKEEVAFLKKLREYTKNIYFVQTKTCLAGSDQVEKWKERNLEILSEQFGSPSGNINIPYFKVDSQMKREADRHEDFSEPDSLSNRFEDLKDSGFGDVYRFIDRYLIPNKERMLALSTMESVEGYAKNEYAHIEERIQIVRETGREKLEQTEVELQQTLDTLMRWRQSGFKDIEIDLFEKIEDLKRETIKEIHIFEPNGIAFEHYFAGITQEFKTAVEVKNRGQSVLEEHSEYCSIQGGKILEAFQKKNKDIYLQTISKGLQEFGEKIQINVPTKALPSIKAGKLDDDAIVQGLLRSGLAGGMVGGGWSLYFGGSVGAALVGAGFSLTPLGWVVAGTIAASSIFAGVHGFRKIMGQKLEVALAKLKDVMRQNALLAKNAISNAFNKTSTQMIRAARKGLAQYFVEIQEDLEGRLQEVRLTKKRTVEENQAVLKELQEQRNALEKLLREMENLITQNEP